MLAESDDDHALLVERWLKRSRLANNLMRVRDGDELSDRLRAGAVGDCEPPDVLLLDLGLPKQNGYELLHWIRTEEALRRVRVAVLVVVQGEEERCRQRGFDADVYVRKPITGRGWRQLVSRLGLHWGICTGAEVSSGQLAERDGVTHARPGRAPVTATTGTGVGHAPTPDGMPA